MSEASLYDKLENQSVRCRLCAWRCTILPGRRGFCNVRQNNDGRLFSMVYGRAISYAVDPIEKKPLYHFHPGTTAFSVATVGCNFRCNFCDNWVISQEKEVSGEVLIPEGIVENALKMGCSSISYTYTEPTIFFEYAYDTAKIARGAGLYNTFVTNGYMTPEAVDAISPYLDAATVDFKGSGDPSFYRSFCGVKDAAPVFDALLEMKKNGIFIETTNLIVPGKGEDRAAFLKLVNWIRDELGDEVPFHILRFFPSYKYEGPGTTASHLLEELWQTARDAGLKYVYLGNVPGHRYENTYCPKCGKIVIERYGFDLGSIKLKGENCGFCGAKINVRL